MTQPQKDALAKAWPLLSEHFDSVVLTLNWEEEIDGQAGYSTQTFWSGGKMAAIGMCRVAEKRILTSSAENVEPNEY